MKFQKLLMTGCRDMDKKHQKYPKNGGFPPFMTPKIFFKNRALSLLYPYGALTSCETLEKNNEQSPRYLKTDYRTDGLTDGLKGDYYGPHLVNPGSKKKSSSTTRKRTNPYYLQIDIEKGLRGKKINHLQLKRPEG